MQSCDKEVVRKFDYSGLGSEFHGLSKPAKRALVNNGILCADDLAMWTERDVMQLAGFVVVLTER